MKVLVVQLCPAFCDHMDFPARFSHPWNSPGKNTGVGCHFLLRGYLCHPGIKPGSPALQADSLMLSQVIVNNIILLTYVFTMPTASPINKLIFVCVCVCVRAQSIQSCPTLRPQGMQPARFLCPWDSPRIWHGLPGSPPEDLPNPGFKRTLLMFPASVGSFFIIRATWETLLYV